jgi:hypothetical protein
MQASYVTKMIEEYLKGFVGSHLQRYVEIFVDPTPREMRDMGKDIRFLADNRTKHIYAWPAFSAIHHEVVDELGLEGARSRGDILPGTAEKFGGKYVMTSSEYLQYIDKSGIIDKVIQQEWGWVDRYIEVSSWVSGERTMRNLT